MNQAQSKWQKDNAERCPCGGSDEYCTCQNVAPVDADDIPPMPAEIMAWRHRPALWWLGSWATTRYPEDAVAYVPKTDFERVKQAAELGLKMAEANDLWNTAETIREALEKPSS